MEAGIVMHLLPFQIQHSGTANVSSFFKIEKTNLTFEGMAYQLTFSAKIWIL
jgi:hypothetical protein